MTFTRMPAALSIVAVLAACGTQAPTRPNTPRSDHKVLEVSADQVAGCQYIDEFISVSGKGTLAAAARAQAQRDVLNQAGNRGATHVVYGEPTEAYGSTTTRGKGYKCP